ncbi:SRPBCC family protein [Pyxidicoccus parkwayensis]|uniref:SRPBCC family protein n=1 Tax=Pyxidicoccus parkwayensis TaxID=2813578 RepID=A0ABX7NRN9_9BACT|nr:SRPBCC family protein [Pyxidicoccus parkwaysis]QSQ21103.1 SRPBCC family protein [Pyxidicoccus parkwaysis]
MAEKPRESQAPRSRSTPGAVPFTGPSRDWDWHDIEARKEGEGRAGTEKVGRVRRAARAFLGGALLGMGLKSRSVGGMAMAFAGGRLIVRGTRGHSLAAGLPGLRKRALTGRGAREEGVVTGGTVMERSITIQKPGHELYREWRVAENLSRVMGHFADVTRTGPDVLHWKVQGPFGRTFEWDSHVVEEQPGEFLRWESLKGAQVPNSGWVRFRPAPGDWGTVVTLRLFFSPPGGTAADAAMKLFGEVPTALAARALRRFKSLVETGEIPTTNPNPAARDGGQSSS